MTRKFYALLSSGDLVGFGTFEGFTQAWLEEPADAVFILDDQGLEKLRQQSTELLNSWGQGLEAKVRAAFMKARPLLDGLEDQRLTQDQDQGQGQDQDQDQAQALFQTLDTPGLQQDQDLPLFQDQDLPLPLPLFQAPALNYRKLEAELLPHLVTEVTVDGWTVSINMPELRGSFERDRDGLGGSLTFRSVTVVDPETGKLRRGAELIDYDGVFALPRPVFKQLKAWGVVMDETFDPDYEVQP